MAAKEKAAAAAAPAKKGEAITASVQILPLPAGLYLFSVKSGSPAKAPVAGGLRLPALQVVVGPGVPADRVQFMPSNTNNGSWLSQPGDLLAIKVHPPAATLLVNSVRGPGGAELAVKVDKLDGSALPALAPAAAPAPVAAPAKFRSEGPRLRIAAHIRSRGDVNFEDVEWAGRLGQGLWLESFAVIPQEQVDKQDIEYKGLTASGFESPWLSNGVACGTRGLATPLIGFAVRLKAAAAVQYDCEYSGYFQSGLVVGPLKNGTPCLSTSANDPLEGLQVRLVKKSSADAGKKPATAVKPAKRK